MEKMEIYNAVRTVPPEAKKLIQAGRLKGMTDVNPMWRIKALTEQFGACGVGWKTVNVEFWTEQGSDGAVAAMCKLGIAYKQDGEWSDPVIGIGGSMLVAKEAKGLYTSDEGFKMAYTDAISVAAKMLGCAADVYFDKDRTKYTAPEEPKVQYITREQKEELIAFCTEKWGGNAAACLQDYSGYEKTGMIPANDFDRVKQALMDAPTF